MFSDDLGFRMFDFGFVEPGLCLLKRQIENSYFFPHPKSNIRSSKGILSAKKKTIAKNPKFNAM
jgi:hypothetical protein